MAKNRVIYLLTLLAGVVFYLAYRQWLGWLLFVALLCLPILSLLLSLPALLSVKLVSHCPQILQQNEKAILEIWEECLFPIPVYGCQIEVRRCITAEKFLLQPEAFLPTEHCGALLCCIQKAWAYDYLGLFRFRLRQMPAQQVVVRPREIPVSEFPLLEHKSHTAWRPKNGGGFAENHELRLYRPGDNLNQIHWKLSAKTGKFIIREPMIPAGYQGIVCLCITGDAKELDEKFGRLLHVCRQLLEWNMLHEIGVISADAIERHPIENEAQLIDTVDRLLHYSPVDEEQDFPAFGVWTYTVGGRAHE